MTIRIRGRAHSVLASIQILEGRTWINIGKEDSRAHFFIQTTNLTCGLFWKIMWPWELSLILFPYCSVLNTPYLSNLKKHKSEKICGHFLWSLNRLASACLIFGFVLLRQLIRWSASHIASFLSVGLVTSGACSHFCTSPSQCCNEYHTIPWYLCLLTLILLTWCSFNTPCHCAYVCNSVLADG